MSSGTDSPQYPLYSASLSGGTEIQPYSETQIGLAASPLRSITSRTRISLEKLVRNGSTRRSSGESPMP